MEFNHQTVLLQETINLLDPKPGGIYIDATLGGGGHAAAICERIGPTGRLIGIDQDETALQAAAERLQRYQDRLTLVRRNFKEIGVISRELGISAIDGAVFDLGVSSPQLDMPERGFSYQHDAPLDMRMDRRQTIDARYLVNHLPEEELVRIIRDYGEERWAKRIAEFIVQARQKKAIDTTGQLTEIIKAAIPAAARREGPHPAKRTFQALRIAVNNELAILPETLEQTVDLLKPGGRIAVITFHSLEDRIVKQTFQNLMRGCTCPPGLPVCLCGKKPVLQAITRKPVTAGAAELARNPRARSAKLRVVERLTVLTKSGGE